MADGEVVKIDESAGNKEGFYSRAEHEAYHRAVRDLHRDFREDHPGARHDHYTWHHWWW
jgi:hypothetical protein